MEFKKILKSINLPLSAFLVYLVKLLIFGTSYQDALLMLILGAVFCVIEYYKAKKDVVTEAIFRVEIQKEIQALKTQIATQKMGMGFSRTQGR